MRPYPVARPAGTRRPSARHLVALGLVALLSAGLPAGCDLGPSGSGAGGAAGDGPAAPTGPAAHTGPAVGQPQSASVPGMSGWPAGERLTDPVVGYPEAGTGGWDLAPGQSAVIGARGPLLRFQVAVERDITGLDRQDFADRVVAVLAGPASWAATGAWRLQRVDAGQPASFTIHLATPATRDVLCRSTSPDRYTSCRRDNRVVLNVARWAHGAPRYGDDLTSYREYMVNHEVGHRLGQGHELCPGPGRPAPVMQQQTLGLHGCLPNPLVLLDGVRYAGPSGQYNDPIPR